MKLSRWVKLICIGVFVCVGLSAVIYAGLYGWIQLDTHKKAKTILMAYPQANDEVDAAILQMQSLSCTMKERNEAVWVLGRLSDEKALPALEREYTGRPCEHDKYLCQHELEKAIRRCGGNIKTVKSVDGKCF